MQYKGNPNLPYSNILDKIYDPKFDSPESAFEYKVENYGLSLHGAPFPGKPRLNLMPLGMTNHLTYEFQPYPLD